jgi:hypothetical protein
MDARDPSTVAAISRGSREAFVALFDRTSDTIRAELALHLPNESHAVPVFAATYVEVWWLAGCRPGPELDAEAWIKQILHRRIGEEDRNARQLPRTPVLSVNLTLDPRSCSAELELAALLGRPVRRLRPN